MLLSLRKGRNNFAFCCIHFPLCHALLPQGSSSPSQRNMERLYITLHDPLFGVFNLSPSVLMWSHHLYRKALQRSHFSNSHIANSLWALTRIISLFNLALVNLFIASCLPSLSAVTLLRADVSCTKDIQASQSQVCSLAAMHCCPVFAVWKHSLSKTQPQGSQSFGTVGALIMFPSERARHWGWVKFSTRIN